MLLEEVSVTLHRRVKNGNYMISLL